MQKIEYGDEWDILCVHIRTCGSCTRGADSAAFQKPSNG